MLITIDKRGSINLPAILLLKIHQWVKGRFVDSEVFVLRRELTLEQMSRTGGYPPGPLLHEIRLLRTISPESLI